MDGKILTLENGTYGNSKAPVIYFTDSVNGRTNYLPADTPAHEMVKQLKDYTDNGYSIAIK
mgnify:CR=1 FL=1